MMQESNSVDIPVTFECSLIRQCYLGRTWRVTTPRGTFEIKYNGFGWGESVKVREYEGPGDVGRAAGAPDSIAR